MKKIICAGNWKLNKGPKETKAFFESFLPLLSPQEESQFVFFPPALALSTLSQSLQGRKVGFGLQNCFAQNSGAFTGENSVTVAKDLGATHILIGHSERRQIFKETDQECAQKVKHVQEQGLIPVLCVGETLAERQQGKTTELVLNQVQKGLALADLNKTFWIAYEPVWAIGTGQVATPAQAEDVHAQLRELLQNKLKISQFVPILYGGSVKPDNAKELSLQKNVDGFLVGGASLDPQGFYSIFKSSMF